MFLGLGHWIVLTLKNVSVCVGVRVLVFILYQTNFRMNVMCIGITILLPFEVLFSHFMYTNILYIECFSSFNMVHY